MRKFSRFNRVTKMADKMLREASVALNERAQYYVIRGNAQQDAIRLAEEFLRSSESEAFDFLRQSVANLHLVLQQKTVSLPSGQVAIEAASFRGALSNLYLAQHRVEEYNRR